MKNDNRLFNKKANELSDKYNIDKIHAECFLVNYEDNYICKEYNGGCDGINICRRIKDDCNRD